jgi:glutaminase
MSPLPIADALAAVYREVATNDAGDVATYIPALAAADPSWFGISLVTVEGESYDLGDADRQFTIQSISKPFVFGMALEDLGIEATLARVGVEPTGNPFNTISVDEVSRRPFNPMVNAGAIVTSSLLVGSDPKAKLQRMLDGFAALLGREPEIDEGVFESESKTGDRNRAIGYFLRAFDMLPSDVDAVLDLYFRQCSILVSCHDLAVMAATIANRGINPVTGDRALPEHLVPQLQSVMATCGMYDFAGEWVYRVGMPAKSGVSGGILASLPGQIGIGVFSPPLDSRGNSVRGIAVCEQLSQRFGLHALRPVGSRSTVVRRVFRGDAVRSKRVRTPGETAALRSAGHEITVLELQGDIVFATVEALSRAIARELSASSFLVLDTKRIDVVDVAAEKLLAELPAMAAEYGVTLVATAHAPAFAPGAHLVTDTRDAALEWCEDQLVARDATDHVDAAVDLADHELLAGLDADELEAITAAMPLEPYPKGAVVFEEGDPATELYLVMSGVVSVTTSIEGRRHRLATIGAGSAFGEMAAVDGGARSTTVVADEDTTCRVLSLPVLADLRDRAPGIATVLYANLARSLSQRLRDANHEIRALED